MTNERSGESGYPGHNEIVDAFLQGLGPDPSGSQQETRSDEEDAGAVAARVLHEGPGVPADSLKPGVGRVAAAGAVALDPAYEEPGYSSVEEPMLSPKAPVPKDEDGEQATDDAGAEYRWQPIQPQAVDVPPYEQPLRLFPGFDDMGNV